VADEIARWIELRAERVPLRRQARLRLGAGLPTHTMMALRSILKRLS
jgi:hypothetical protein